VHGMQTLLNLHMVNAVVNLCVDTTGNPRGRTDRFISKTIQTNSNITVMTAHLMLPSGDLQCIVTS